MGMCCIEADARSLVQDLTNVERRVFRARQLPADTMQGNGTAAVVVEAPASGVVSFTTHWNTVTAKAYEIFVPSRVGFFMNMLLLLVKLTMIFLILSTYHMVVESKRRKVQRKLSADGAEEKSALEDSECADWQDAVDDDDLKFASQPSVK
mmetsp:Transcript_79737/g.182687  ORF Transcript_79737/g.182687 Transcript_79737/m.182687 type:complete len:151 (+) Transcript_79737:69-521(+)